MRTMLFLFALGALGLSGFAGWFFFGGPEDDPTRIKLAAALSEMEALRPKAEAGGTAIQYKLAGLYYDAQYGAQNRKEAFKWYSRAAEKGHIGAQYAVGGFYARGEVVNQNYYRAAEWYRLAANLGSHPGAQLALGELYFHGRGVPSGYAEALDWFKKAADQGQPTAQHFLGAMYAEGWAGAFDAVKAYQWFTLALRHPDRVRAHNPDLDSGKERQRVAAKMTEDQIKRGEDAAKAWLRAWLARR